MDDRDRSTRHAFMHSFNMYPRIRFEMQHKDEHVILVLRRHPFTLIPWIFNALVGLILALVLGLLLFPQFLEPKVILVFLLFALSFILSYAWVNFLIWYFTVGIVTNTRILDFDFYNLIYKEFSATTIRQVSDLTTTIGGFFGSILNFGDVMVKTEGFEQNIEFDDIPDPSLAVKIINELMQKIKKNIVSSSKPTHGRII
ncbi:hypothetical protein KC726_01670 [Candidatus Woesebacteria bacterium]|nr:hypothetical protein [Candidatus Woesebacteria bacterium]